MSVYEVVRKSCHTDGVSGREEGRSEGGLSQNMGCHNYFALSGALLMIVTVC